MVINDGNTKNINGMGVATKTNTFIKCNGVVATIRASDEGAREESSRDERVREDSLEAIQRKGRSVNRRVETTSRLEDKED